jgi:hypothetical protein
MLGVNSQNNVAYGNKSDEQTAYNQPDSTDDAAYNDVYDEFNDNAVEPTTATTSNTTHTAQLTHIVLLRR